MFIDSFIYFSAVYVIDIFILVRLFTTFIGVTAAVVGADGIIIIIIVVVVVVVLGKWFFSQFQKYSDGNYEMEIGSRRFEFAAIVFTRSLYSLCDVVYFWQHREGRKHLCINTNDYQQQCTQVYLSAKSL